MAASRIRLREFPQWAARRAVRAAILVPGTFAISFLLLRDPTAALFSAFGSTTLLLYVDFGGPIRPRVQSQLALIVGTAALLCIGTLAQQNIWVATGVTLVVTFGILFFGIASSVLANAQASLLISFLLPLTLPGPLDALPDRLLGWGLASLGSLIAITLIWRGPTNDPLRSSAIISLGALAGRVRDLAASAELPKDDTGRIVMVPELVALKRSFLQTPFRPSGLGAAGRELAKLVEQQVQLEQVLREIGMDHPQLSPEAKAVFETSADLLDECAIVLRASRSDTSTLAAHRDKLAGLRQASEAAAIAETKKLPRKTKAADQRGPLTTIIAPSFDAQELSVIVDSIAERTILSASARNRSWVAHLLGLRSEVISPALSTARDRLASHIDRRSVWLHNALRGSIGFALTVFVANAIGVQHAFWVAFGTLAVLRSNASATGQTALKAILGTLIGIVVGGVLLVVLGHNTLACWILLPLLVAFIGLAPAFSFVAGQAGFSVLLIVLFNLMQPIQWTIGIVRIEDVAIGCAVSVVVGFLLWPRGAGSAFAIAMSNALGASARYLAASIDYALQRCGGGLSKKRSIADGDGMIALDAARRLDDSFRQLLTERGAKLLSFDELACMVSAAAVVRRTADEIRGLWQRADEPAPVTEEARSELLARGQSMVERYEQIAAALVGKGEVPDAASEPERNSDDTVDALWSEASGGSAALTETVRLLWTLDYLDSLYYLDRNLLPAATKAAEAAASPAAWLVGIRRIRAVAAPRLGALGS